MVVSERNSLCFRLASSWMQLLIRYVTKQNTACGEMISIWEIMCSNLGTKTPASHRENSATVNSKAHTACSHKTSLPPDLYNQHGKRVAINNLEFNETYICTL